MSGGLMIKVRRGEKIAVVRDGDSGHSAACCLSRKLADFARAIEE
jgi:hypothetical protein